MLTFKFGEKEDGKSPPKKYLLKKCDGFVQSEIFNTLKAIERSLRQKNINQALQANAFKEIKGIKDQKESLFQINQKCSDKREYRILFVLRQKIGLILSIFLKKNDSQEKNEYKKAIDKAEYYK
jgi:hypothetical protein